MEIQRELIERNSLRNGFVDFAAGSLGGVAQVYVSQPLDTVKVKQQTFPNLYKNMVDCFMKTYRKDGIFRGLYAGSIPAVASNIAENSVLFTAYGGCQKFVAWLQDLENTKELSILGNAFSGFLAAFFAAFALCPTELVKCKLQAMHEYSMKSGNIHSVPVSPFQLTKQIYCSEGFAGFFRGLTPTFLREMPGYFFFFGGYDGTRTFFTKYFQCKSKDDIGPIKTMISGAVGGITFWLTVFPADAIKSRIQVNNLKCSMTTVGLKMLRSEGIGSFYNGLFPTQIIIV